MNKITLPVLFAALIGLGAGFGAIQYAPSPSFAAALNQKGDTTKEGVPASCARIVNPAERRKCLQSVGK